MGKPNQVPVTCAICGTEWTVKASRASQNSAITCSRECLSQLQSRNRIRHFGTEETRVATCATCGKAFERKPSQLAKYGQSFCSRTCANVGREVPNHKLRTGQWLLCEMCGKAIWRTAATTSSHNYCSLPCANSHNRDVRSSIKPNMQGAKHPHWQGGRSFLPYAPGWSKRIKMAIKERDGFQCRVCDLAPEDLGRLVIHHIDHQKTNHHPSNLITLCRSCHSRVHHGSVQLPA